MLLRSIAMALPLLLTACDDENVVPEEPAKATNVQPSYFGVTVLKVGSTYATIEWGPNYDEDNDPLYHTIYLEGTPVMKGLRSDSIFTFEGLKPLKQYFGEILVTDSINEPVRTPFSFNTKKYFNTFSRVFDGYTGRVPSGYSIDKTVDGGFIVAGQITLSQGPSVFYLLKVDSLGFEQWHTILEDRPILADGIVRQTDDRGYIAVFSNNIYKLAESGELTWRVNGPAFESIVETPNHEYIAVIRGGAVARYDANGNLLWHKYYDEDESVVGKYMTRAGDGDYVVLGTTSVGYGRNLTITKIDGEGDVLWSKTYNDEKSASAEQIHLTHDNGFVIASERHNEYGSKYATVMKIDPDGNLQWENEYKNALSTFCKGITETRDGSFVFAGYNEYRYSTDAILGKLDRHGKMLWVKSYDAKNLISYKLLFNDILLTSSGGFVTLGVKDDNGPSSGMWILRTNDEGETE